MPEQQSNMSGVGMVVVVVVYTTHNMRVVNIFKIEIVSNCFTIHL